jgi:hypothetical protein
MTPLLSELIHSRGYVPRDIRLNLPLQERRWRDKDFALNTLGVHHLHISHPPEAGKAQKGNEIAFVEFAPNVARFVLAGTHADFRSERLAVAVANMRALMGFTFKGVVSRESAVAHDKLSALVASGYSTYTHVDGQVVPLSLISSDGTSIFLMKQLMLIDRTLRHVEPKVDDPEWVRSLFGYAPSSPWSARASSSCRAGERLSPKRLLLNSFAALDCLGV